MSFPVWKGNLRFGAEVSNIHRTDRYSGDADYIADNDVKIDETTSALFAETDQTFGPISAGALFLCKRRGDGPDQQHRRQQKRRRPAREHRNVFHDGFLLFSTISFSLV